MLGQGGEGPKSRNQQVQGLQRAEGGDGDLKIMHRVLCLSTKSTSAASLRAKANPCTWSPAQGQFNGSSPIPHPTALGPRGHVECEGFRNTLGVRYGLETLKEAPAEKFSAGQFKASLCTVLGVQMHPWLLLCPPAQDVVSPPASSLGQMTA